MNSNIFVLLTDDDNEVALVTCPDEESAEQVAAAAVFSNGGVSAWMLPTNAITEWRAVIERLRDGLSAGDVQDLESVVVTVNA